MKHFFTKAMLAITVLTGLYSCNNDDDGPSPDDQQAFAELYKKWEVQGTPSASGSKGTVSLKVDLDKIASIEFTDEGVFVIVETTGKIITGNYTIDAATSTLSLEDTGTITINELDNAELDFTFELTDRTLDLVAKPAMEVPTNTSNRAMFRLWELQNLDEFNANAQTPSTKLQVLFTPYGTYLIKDWTQDGELRVDNSYWQWKNTDQTEICYNRYEGGSFNCQEIFFKILSLTASEFRIQDFHQDDGQEEYILVPAK